MDQRDRKNKTHRALSDGGVADDYVVSESHLSCFVFPLECYFQDADIWDVRGLLAFEDGGFASHME